MKNLFIILSAAILLVSCTERIDIELDSTYDRLAVEGHISTDTMTHWVKLTRSSDYYSGNPPIPVTDAAVIISDGAETIAFEEDPENTGFYKSPPDYYGVPGKTYTLNIELAEEIGGYKDYSAHSELNPVEEIDSIRVVYNDDWQVYEVQIFALEPPTTDFYAFDVLKNGKLLTDTIDKVWISDDRFFNGNYTLGALVGILDPDDPREVPAIGDTITLKMSNITKEYYNFILELQDQTFQYRNPLFSGPPANITTNIENAHGFFAAYATTYSSTVYRGD